jgi:hypothetical protein
MFYRRSKPQIHRSEYATRNDFKQIFTEDMAGLHLLAFLLTADQTKAEHCFVAGLEDSINGNPVFRQWARSWSKRAIIKRAIRMIAPTPADPRHPAAISAAVSEREALIRSVTSLAPFQRFVFAMAVLEGYSTTECALLLRSTVKEVMAARAEALHAISLHRSVDLIGPDQSITWKEFLPSANAA